MPERFVAGLTYFLDFGHRIVLFHGDKGWVGLLRDGLLATSLRRHISLPTTVGKL